MITKAEIYIWGRPLGTIEWNPARNVGVFEYCEAYFADCKDLAPLQMPLANRNQKRYYFSSLRFATFRGLPGMLADSLPDHFGNQLLQKWLHKMGHQTRTLNPVAQLCFVGDRGMGALEFKPVRYQSSKDTDRTLGLQQLVALANDFLGNRISFSQLNLFGSTIDDLKHLLKVGTSAGGARPKAIVSYSPISGALKAGLVANEPGFEDWLLKFDGVGKKKEAIDDLGRLEYAYYKMALAAGLEMMPSKLIEDQGRAHFLTKRFDRGHGQKVHSQSLCAMGHFDFRDSGAIGYDDAFQVLRKLNMDRNAIEQLYRRMLFNVFGRNQDDHTKNIGFLLSEHGNWELSPAFDVTYAYNPHGQWTRLHRMHIGGKRDSFTRKELIEFGKQNDVSNSSEIFDAVLDAVGSWQVFADQAQLKPSKTKAIHDTLRLNWN